MCLIPASDHIPVNTEDDVEFEGDNGEVGERNGEEVEGDISVDIDKEDDDEDDEGGSRFKRSRNDSRPSKRSLDDVNDYEYIEPNGRKGTKRMEGYGCRNCG